LGIEPPNIMRVKNKREKKWTGFVGLRVGDEKCIQNSYAEK
jgi:hypothetical protein